FILIFFSQNSVAKRGYVQREMKLALDTWEEVPEGQIHTIPIRLDPCQIPERFSKFQWVDLFREGGFQRMVRAIRFGSEQRQQPEYVASPEEPTKRAIEFEPILSGELKMKSHDSEEHEQHTHRSPARSSEITLIDASLDPKDSPYEQIIEGGRKII